MELADTESECSPRGQLFESVLANHAVDCVLAVLPEVIKHEVLVEVGMVHVVSGRVNR